MRGCGGVLVFGFYDRLWWPAGSLALGVVMRWSVGVSGAGVVCLAWVVRVCARDRTR